MRTKHTYLFLAISSIIALSSCSTKKNTSGRRFYHSFTTKYNVYFNANEAFKKGEKKVEDQYQPDYSHIIDMFAISNKATEGIAKTDMTTVEEKCQKAIKEHSIKKKPKKNVNRTRDPKYMEFYNKEEFNKKMYDVWLLLGKAKFYSNDYLAASATFTYIIKHFPENKELVAEASVWKARALKEMDWTYEAEGTLENMSDEAFTPSINNLYSAAYADLKIKNGDLAEALPYLYTAIETEKKKKIKTRYRFVAAQICQILGQNQKAYELYGQVIKSSPDYQMAFNARVRQTEVYDGQNSEALIKSLQKMAKKSNNKDYLDQIYYAIGNVYIRKQDTTNAIANYKLSIEKSTRNGLDKAQSLITLGTLYYNKADYIKAEPCFTDAVVLIDQSYPNYNNINNLAQVLGELAQQYNIVHLQDSLIALSKMSKTEQLAAAQRQIDLVREEEKKEQERLKQEEIKSKQLENEIENMAVMDKRALGGVKTADWYFYNQRTVSKGKLEFQRKFGNRRLEDNWNRKNKAFVAMDEIADNNAKESEDNEKDEQSTDSTKSQQKGVVDNKNPQYYLNQIPKGEEQIAAANFQVADALYEMANIYNEKLNDYKKAEETYNEFVRRFPNDARGADALFICYRNQEKSGNDSGKEKYKSELLAKYPDSKYAKILSQPDFRAQLERMMAMQDSIYEQTYKDYLNSNFNKVMETANNMEKEFPVSPLIPKFMLLKSLSAGKIGDKDSLTNSLNTLLARYPNSDVATMAKDVLALMAQGNTPQAGNNGSLASMREKVLTDSLAAGEPKLKGFRYNEKTPYLYYMITDPAEVRENWLLYYTASYNFTKFLVKDFDLRVKNGTLVVSGLDNLEEALWYAKGIDEDKDMNKLLEGKKHRSLVISAENSELIGRGFTIEQYEQFYQDSIINRKKVKSSAVVELVGEEKAIDSLKNASSKLSVKAGDDLMNAKTTVNTAKEQKAEEKKEEAKQPKENEQSKAENKPQEQKQEQTPAQPRPSAPKEKKELKKYKGLYTYDVDADHKFVIIVTKDGADVTNLIEAINKFNSEKQPLLNLKVSKTAGKGFNQMIEVGILPGAKTAKSYLLQLAKDDSLRDALDKVPHRRIVISEDNLETLKTSGNINVYMELFRRLYLGR